MPIIRVYFDDTLHWWKYEFDEEKTGIYSKWLASQDAQHLILKDKGLKYGSLEDWSRDGQWILTYGRGGFWKMRPDGSDTTHILKIGYGNGFPNFSPDGKKYVMV